MSVSTALGNLSSIVDRTALLIVADQKTAIQHHVVDSSLVNLSDDLEIDADDFDDMSTPTTFVPLFTPTRPSLHQSSPTGPNKAQTPNSEMSQRC